MFQKLRPRSAYDVFAVLALFLALATGGAYAANTIGTNDVIDGSLLSQDIKDNGLTGSDIQETTLAKVPDADALDGRTSGYFAKASLFGDDTSIGSNDTSALDCRLGDVLLTASPTAPHGYVQAAGQLLPISQNTALFARLGGNVYGGDGKSTFALPDLRDAAPRSANGAPTHYVVCIEGAFV